MALPFRFDGAEGNGRYLRSGRDDTSVCGLWFETENSGEPRGAPQIPPLRFAPVGMTKGRVALPFRFDGAEGNSGSLLFASLRSG